MQSEVVGEFGGNWRWLEGLGGSWVWFLSWVSLWSSILSSSGRGFVGVDSGVHLGRSGDRGFWIGGFRWGPIAWAFS